MSMILDENGYERMAAHQRAASRAAVARADENEKLKERIKELEAELERWKPKPMSSAPRDGTVFYLVNDGGCIFTVSDDAGDWYDHDTNDYIVQGRRFICWFPLFTAEELKQIGGAK